jgi:hypothetical protein
MSSNDFPIKSKHSFNRSKLLRPKLSTLIPSFSAVYLSNPQTIFFASSPFFLPNSRGKISSTLPSQIKIPEA